MCKFAGKHLDSGLFMCFLFEFQSI